MKFSSLRSIQAVLAIGSFFLLTAAKGDGCGTSVIVDQPDTVWALTSGGPAAIGYLNTALVDQLAKQIK